MKIVVISGGHGGATIARALLRDWNCSLTLIINAFDDGKSTGALREFIPGMLGPSDVRKNLSKLAAGFSPERFALKEILEFRLSGSCVQIQSELQTFSIEGRVVDQAGDLGILLSGLSPTTRDWVRTAVAAFINFERESGVMFQWDGAAFGNILFAGVFLQCDNDFNRACEVLSGYVQPELSVLNVTNSADYYLRGISSAGKLLGSEVEIISPPRGQSVSEIFIHGKRLEGRQRDEIDALDGASKIDWLRNESVTPEVPRSVVNAISQMDLLVVAPGTPYSSILPTLLVLRGHLEASLCRNRILIGNLSQDTDAFDIDNYGVVAAAHEYAGSLRNLDGAPIFSDLLVDIGSTLRSKRDSLIEQNFGTKVSYSSLTSPWNPEVHSGFEVVQAIRRLTESRDRTGVVHVVFGSDVDAQIVHQGLAEFVDIRWNERFAGAVAYACRTCEEGWYGAEGHITNGSSVEPRIMFVDNPLEDLLAHATTAGATNRDVVVVISGDGQYRISDVVNAALLLQRGESALIVGSRVQNRSQLTESLRVIYGDHAAMRVLAQVGAGLVSVAVRVRTGVVLSDPLSGFRAARVQDWQRTLPLAGVPTARLEQISVAAFSKEGLQVSEIPIHYLTLRGFTTPRRRIFSGLSTLLKAVRGHV
jgi:2-phospho-L-lactate transferase/gluconeogenesis factor (CofD/UPF0052 family)